ncbi:hypothetical protein SUGI_0018830 [Cryptomeria japonica]|nr:hypothetical protein SUGI_0018830 [Cryptomeria japonica]
MFGTLFAFGFYPVTPTLYVLGVWFDSIASQILVWTVIKDERDIPLRNAATLKLTNNGLNLYDDQTNLKWSIAVSEMVASASMLDSGNFVLLNAQSNPIWQSFDHPTDTLLPSQMLKWKAVMFSKVSPASYSTGRFQLSMQEDGNLVLYNAERTGVDDGAYWATVTSGELSLKFETSGLLHIVNITNMTVYTLTEGDARDEQFLCRVTLGSEGILAQYVWNTRNASWSSAIQPVSDPCKEVKGQCGRNGICQINSQNEPDCTCPPQFNFIDSDYPFEGCMRSSSPGQNCSSVGSNMLPVSFEESYKLSLIPNEKNLSEEECLQACLNDCVCVVVTRGVLPTVGDAAFYMKMLPMTDGSEGADITSRSFVKVSGDILPPSGKQRKRQVLLLINIPLLVLSLFLLAVAIFAAYVYRRKPPDDTAHESKVVEGWK